MPNSSSNTLFGIGAIFKTPNDIMKAAAAVRDSGYKKFDIHTPYPIHGMDGAMGLKWSRLPWITLVFGLLGVAVGMGFQYWTSAVSYPLVIGGKPLFSWQAFMPIVFECAVLFAAIATVSSLIIIFCGLPNNQHPLHDTNYIKATSCDQYGVFIEANDPKFDEHGVRSFLTALGGDHIEIVSVPKKLSLFALINAPFLLILALLGIGAYFATDIILHDVLTSMPFNWMSEQPKIVPQRSNDLMGKGNVWREKVDGTVARGFIPYEYKDDPEAAGQQLANPISATSENIIEGQRLFQVHCAVCHGEQGKGENALNGEVPRPPSLHSSKVRQWPDGRIFHVITEGQNAMIGYKDKIWPDDRWKIIHFVRALQLSQNATDADLK